MYTLFHLHNILINNSIFNIFLDLEVAMISYNLLPIVLAITINGFHLYSYNVHVITVHVLLENC